MRLDATYDAPDATRIIPGLYQGGAPRSTRSVLEAGFTILVMCAREIPAPVGTGPLRVLRCALQDDASRPLPRQDLVCALRVAEIVARGLQRGERALITCAAGLNRSGLVTALTLHALTGKPGLRCARHIQSRRHGALNNPRFMETLSRFR